MLPATIEKADAATVTVALAVKDERVTRLVGHEIAVEITSGRGIHRFTRHAHGRARRLADDRASAATSSASSGASSSASPRTWT